jgi:hypothetical protein
MPRIAIVMAVLILAGAASCIIDEKRYSDPYACLNKPPPTAAASQIVFKGTVSQAGASIMGANVGVYYDTAPEVQIIGTMSQGDKGVFEMQQGFGPLAPDVFLKAHFNGLLETRYYPAVAPTDVVEVDLQMFSTGYIPIYSTLVGLDKTGGIDMQKAIFAVSVIDCNGQPIGGATVATEPPGDVRYFENGQPSPTASMTDRTLGAAVVVNVPLNMPSNNINITARVGDTVLRSHFIQGAAPMLIQTDIQP